MLTVTESSVFIFRRFGGGGFGARDYRTQPGGGGSGGGGSRSGGGRSGYGGGSYGGGGYGM